MQNLAAPAPLPTPPHRTHATRISARALTKAFGPTRALAGVDVGVEAGEALAIMGPSGSGKSTLLLTLAGIERPDSGQVMYSPAGSAPVDVAAMPDRGRSELRRTDFGFVFQQGLLIPELTAIENVALPLMVLGIPRQAAEAEAAQWLGRMGLAGMEQRRIGELSGGQAQRVAIARAQVGGASVTFADEPTGALDRKTSSEVMDVLLASTVGRGASLVVVTHDATVAARCDRTLTMEDGRISHQFFRTQAAAAQAAAAQAGGTR
ncbi:ABC transporter ATP-binding protein [Galactobacter caseinivorans]|uniref:ABC transporter ATP-binding protein n=1 Tax=Galactobacter caseinivorans TaxID=2676123 RepID=A0A496PI80_9MICC|nr:ABC transporter ATP-binding protein [Galactobacter caseinivorans]RKW70187.1 ABC transporter ATP-binding protein [Galactobacter caseinivorans]